MGSSSVYSGSPVVFAGFAYKFPAIKKPHLYRWGYPKFYPLAETRR